MSAAVTAEQAGRRVEEVLDRLAAGGDERACAAVARVAEQLGDPAHRLRLDLGAHRRQHPRAEVGVIAAARKSPSMPLARATR